MLQLRTIGHVEVASGETASGEAAGQVESRVVVDRELQGGLLGLETGQRVMVIYHFHLSTDYELLQHPPGAPRFEGGGTE